ncbi:unnamed protein product [Arctia plantaginis]|uniref:Uncharacterized protein n=1 Tax=Arctia plantaginis TaxID=874455 RepID=A0A8S1AW51_ARCPL|nr:unnamed protein product [Arctia plantaginis]
MLNFKTKQSKLQTNESKKSFENFATKGSTGRVRRIYQCRACVCVQAARGRSPASRAALLAARPQRRPTLAAPRQGPLTPHTHYLTLVD